MKALRRFTRLEDGQDLLEYGLLASLIALAAIGTIGLVGNHMNDFFWSTFAINI